MISEYPQSRKSLYSMDRTTRSCVDYAEPDRYRWLFQIDRKRKYSLQGGGLSYVAADFSTLSTTINLRNFDRILEFNKDEKKITVEGGITLQKLFAFLSGHGLYVPVQPGHPLITIGGCIAGNVYGKNQVKEGLFCNYVEDINLFHPSHGEQYLSRDKNASLFDLTCGGFGLTGVIISATLKLKNLPAEEVVIENIPVESLEETFHLMDEMKNTYDGIYSWNDLSTVQGKGFIATGKFYGNTGDINQQDYCRRPSSPVKDYPFCSLMYLPPIYSLLTKIYEFEQLKLKNKRKSSWYDYSFPIVTKGWYYSLYGRKGFIEQQILISRDSWDGYIADFKMLCQRLRPRIGLTSCKAFQGEQALLNFNGSGIVLTIDVANDRQHLEFLSELDHLNTSHGAYTNLLKDSRLPVEMVIQQHKHYEEFKQRLHHFDPDRIFVSELSQRLAL